jgi:predicted nucleic acid-binding protein
MIVLDTNVVSEAMKPEPAPAVRDWLDEQAAETLYLSSITLAELLFGIGALPDGRRKQKLAATLDALLGLFGGRILPFDSDAARHYAALAVAARNAGNGFFDAGRLHRGHSDRPRLCSRYAGRQRLQGRGCPDHRPMGGRSLTTRATHDDHFPRLTG